ncbi:hypothetical protein E2F48_04040 [Arthrobacter crusticola]|uniref:Uncharacterized protein n=1 Tax=Arthrobacter crusticola TaxID=2547960 RepID=A0A4R5TYU2_9MICC|nr:hypothetical protein [Arthrobacter crusticola]TDK26380.1 hypothetical protein E2F48_04040 [Arthrobacter crusticola]
MSTIIEIVLDVLLEFFVYMGHGAGRSEYKTYRRSLPQDAQPMTRREWKKSHPAERRRRVKTDIADPGND